jgi:hypothetical protein
MRQKLSRETRRRIAAAGPCEATEVGDLKPGSDQQELFAEYFADSCDDEEARHKWDCYWWLSSNDLSTFVSNPGDRRYRYGGESERKAELLGKFESLYGPRGATPIAWPSEISGWFTIRHRLEDEEKARRQAWNPDRHADDEEEVHAWKAWAKAFDQLKEWEGNNPVPMEPALRFCRDGVQTWYMAFYDDFRNMNQEAVPLQALDPDCIDSLNEVHLKDLAEGQRVKV